jgi:hypothetical protein
MSLTGGSKFILTGGATNYQIARSLRFRDGSSAFLNRTPGVAGNRKQWTLSLWVKRAKLGAAQQLFGVEPTASGSDTNRLSICFDSSDRLSIFSHSTTWRTTTRVFRDMSAWYHIVIGWNTSSGNNSIAVEINGVTETVFTTSNALTTNTDYGVGATNPYRIGAEYNIAGVFTQNYLGAYLAEVHHVDGQTLPASTFAALTAATNSWDPKAVSVSYGTTGFYLPFSDNSAATSTTIGKDSSGNGNNWTPSGISVTAGVTNDSLVDTPTNYGTDTGLGGEVRGNYCTWTPLDRGANAWTPVDGNLSSSTGNTNDQQRGTQFVSSGKWYWEYAVTVPIAVNCFVGACADTCSRTGYPGQYDALGWVYRANNENFNNGASALSTSTYTTGDVIGVALDMDNRRIYFGKQTGGTGSMVWQNTGVPASGTGYINSSVLAAGTSWGPACGSAPGGAATTIIVLNAGQRAFSATAPTGFKALCTQNLPDPAIQKPSLFMDVNTRTGTGAAFNVTGKGFQPDLVWMKGRSGATDHAIYDAVRTATKDLGSNLATDETTQAQGLTAFNSDGFSGGTLAKINTSTATYVDWMWKKGATPGIDVVSYTGNGANRTIAHALGVVPSMMLVKSRTTAGADTGWAVYHSTLANTEYLKLETTAAKATGATYWNSTTPTSSVFSLGTAADTNTNSDTYINYLFAEISGFSKFGSYTGNGSTDGPMVWCVFRPRFFMFKRIDTTNDWEIIDTARDTSNMALTQVAPNLSGAEGAGVTPFLDIVSNGIKIRGYVNAANLNANGGTYIFAAFAESPFKYARAR